MPMFACPSLSLTILGCMPAFSKRYHGVRFGGRLGFPGKNEAERKEVDNALVQAGKWMKVSWLDTLALTRIIEDGLWNNELIDEVMKYGRIEAK